MRGGHGKLPRKDDLRDRAQYPEKRSRDDAVVAQFNTADSATGYAEAHQGSGSTARFFHSRLHIVSQVLAASPGGDLLDVGCGPGMMVRRLLDSWPDDFRITAFDRSLAMVKAAARRAGAGRGVKAVVGQVEAMPFSDDSFDIVLAMGVLEYTELTVALAEIARVTRPGGLVLVTMLNPVSPYRFVEWNFYWPLLRALHAVETRFNVPVCGRYTPGDSGIRAYRERILRHRMAMAGLRPVDGAAFDVTFLVPPISGVVRRWSREWEKRPARTISRRWRKWLGTAYLIVAHKATAPTNGAGS